MASLGGLYFSVGLKDYTDKDWEKIEKKLKDRGLDLGLSIDGNKLNSEIIKALSNRKYTIDLDVAINDKQLEASIRSAYGRITNIGQAKPSSEAALIRANAYAGSQKSLAQSRDALTKLREARLADAAAAGKQVAANKRFTKSIAPMPRMLEGLREQFLNFYSIYTVERFFTQLVSIGGEFEKQHIALQSMLGDAAKADRIFSQIKELAVESPYTFQNLASYTKQLTAFSVPYNELYETTKRLADISAGLGVDMSRLILAFGQVRSAEFLRGTELRQFTEAGIPILDELAQKFTELEGTVVSVGEVFDRISNREVPFEMVRDVLWDLTNEGGQFYKMQEVLTESLSGRLDKLKDSYQIMLSEVSSSNSGILKGMIDMVTALVDSWREVWIVLRSVGAAYVGYKAVILAANAIEVAGTLLKAQNVKLTNAETVATLRNIASLKTRNAVLARYLALRKALNKIKTTKGGYIGLIVSAVAALGSAIWAVTRQATELRRELNKIDKETGGNILSLSANYKALVNDLGRATEGSKEYRDIIAKINSGYGDYLDNLFSEAEAYDNVRNSIDAVSDAIIRKAQNQAYEQKIIAVSNKYNEKFEKVQNDLSRVMRGRQGIDRSLSEQIAARIISLVRSYGYSLEESVNIVSQEFGKDIGKAIERGLELTGMNIRNPETLVDEYNSAINAIGNTGQGGPFQAGLDKIAEMYDNLIKKAKDLNEERNLEIAKLQEQRRYIESLDFSGKGKIISDIDRQIAAYREGTEEWIRISEGVAKRGVSQGEYTFSFNNLAPTKEEYRKSSEYFSRLVKDYEDTQKKLEELNITPLSGQDANWQREKARYEARLQTIRDIYKANDSDIEDYLKKEAITATGKDDPIAEQWKERLDLMQQAEKEFAKWQALVGTEKASTQLRESGIFDALGNFDFADAWGEIGRFAEQMFSNATTDKQRDVAKDALEAVIEFTYDENRTNLDKALENINQVIEQTTKRWNLFKNLMDSTGNRTLAMNLAFGGTVAFDNQSDEFSSRITDMIKGSGFTLDEVLSMDESELKKNGLAIVAPLVDAFRESQMQIQDDTINTLSNLISKYKDYAAQIADIERKKNEDIERINQNRKSIGGQTADSLIAQREKEAREAIASIEFEQFKEDNDWGRVFDDLDRVSTSTLDTLIEGMENYQGVTDLSVEDTKKFIDALRKLRNEKIDRDPIGSFISATGNLSKWRNALKRMNSDGSDSAIVDGKIITRQQAEDNIAEQSNVQLEAIDDVIKKLQSLGNAIDTVTEFFSALGINGMDNIGNILSGTIGGASSLGSVGAQFFGEVGGIWGAAIGAAMGLVTSIFQLHDKRLQRQIEESERIQTQLENVYSTIENRLQYYLGNGHNGNIDIISDDIKDLERVSSYIEDIRRKSNINLIDIANLQSANKEMSRLQARVNSFEQGGIYGYQRNLLEEQLAEVRKQRDLESRKKKPDQDALLGYDKEIGDLKDQIRYFAQDLANELYGIDIKGWAQQIGDALFDAWKKGEDAVQAYRDTVADIMGELMNKVLTMSIIEPAMKELQTYLFGEDGESGAFGSDLELDNKEIEGVFGIFSNLEETIAAWEKGMDKLNESGEKYGFDLKEMLGGDDLTEGIKGITEDTANLLASYLNAIRQDVSVQRRLWEAFIGGMNFNQINVIAQAQLTQLQAIAVNTKNSADSAASILTLLNSVSNGTRRFYMK